MSDPFGGREDDFDIDDYLKKIEESNDIRSLMTASSPEDYDIDRMLRELGMESTPKTDATTTKIVNETLNMVEKALENPENEMGNEFQAERSTFNIMIDTVDKDAGKTTTELQELITSPSARDRIQSSASPEIKLTQMTGGLSSVRTPSQYASGTESRRKNSNENPLDPMIHGSIDKPSRDSGQKSGSISRPAELESRNRLSSVPENPSIKKPSLNADGGSPLLKETFNTKPDIVHKLFVKREDDEVKPVQTDIPEYTPRRRKSFDDNWVDDIEKKIRYNEIDHLHEKHKLNYKKIFDITKNMKKGLHRKEDNRSLEKTATKIAREGGLNMTAQSPFKYMMEKFDHFESRAIRDVKAKRKDNFYSALKECSWNSSAIQPMSFDKCANIQELLKGQYSGSITCFAFSPSDHRHLVVIGTDSGDVIELDLVGRKCRKHKLDNKVLSLDISKDKEKWVAGLDSGEIFLKRTYGTWTSKRLKIDDRPINQVRFAGNDHIITASDFNAYRLNIKDLKVMFDVTKLFILQKSPDVITQLYMLQTDSKLKLVLTTSASIRLYELTDDDTEEIFEIERPSYVREGAVPTVSWLSPDDKASSYLIIFWDNCILLIQDNGPDSSIVGMKQLAQRIVWGCILRNRVICYIYDDLEVHLDSMQNIFVSLLSGGGFEAKYKLTKNEYTKARNLSVSPDGSLMQSWSEVIRNYDNNIFFLKNDGIFKMYLYTLKEMAYMYSERGEWLPAFKLCCEVCNDRIRANKDEKDQMKVEIKTLAWTYTDKFFDKSKKADEVQTQITRICIDAMTSSDNIEYLFGKLRAKFDDLCFWREVETFIENGLIEKIPLDALFEGGLYLQADSLMHVVYQYSLADFQANEEHFNQLLMMLKRRKLWIALYRLGLIVPEAALGLILSTMSADMMALTQVQDTIKQKIAEMTERTEEAAREMMEDQKVATYFRLFWYLNKIVTWHVASIIDSKGSMETVWVKTIEWLVDPANVKVLSTVNISLYLEVYFELFMNTDFTSSDKVAHNLRQRVKMIDEHMKNSKPGSTEDNSGNNGFYTFKAVLEVLFLFCDPKYKPDISFLALKLINLSIFSQMMEDRVFVTGIIKNLLSEPFVGERLWFHYEGMARDDFEEQIIRVITSVQSDELIAEAKRLSKVNQHYRVYSIMVDMSQGEVEALKVYLQYVNYGNPTYLFNWIKRKLMDSKSANLMEFSRLILANLSKLTSMSKTRAKEVITLLPNVGSDAIESLQEYPDLQINYLESLLENEAYLTQTGAITGQNRLPSQLRLLYLQLLCIHRPSSVYSALVSFDFPLDESLELVQKYQVREAIASLKYKLGRAKDAVEEYKIIIADSIQKFLDSNTDPLRQLSLALFAFDSITSICENTFKDEENEGAEMFLDFLAHMTETFARLISSNANSGIETKVRAFEVKNFLFQCMLEELIAIVARYCGTAELAEIFRNEMANVKIRELTSLLKLMHHEKSLIDNVGVIIQKDLATEMSSWIHLLKLARMQGNRCGVCEQEVYAPYMINPAPCLHPVHLKCAAENAEFPKDLVCRRCLPVVSLNKQIGAVLSKYPQEDLPNRYDDIERRELRKRAALGDPELNRLQRALRFEDYSDHLSWVENINGRSLKNVEN